MTRETMFDELRKVTVNNWYRCTVGTHFIHVRDVHHPGGVELGYDVYDADGNRGTSENPLELRNLNEYRQLEKLSDAEVTELQAKIKLAQIPARYAEPESCLDNPGSLHLTQ